MSWPQLLRRKDQAPLEEPERWDEQKKEKVIEPAPERLEDFRAEVRIAYQLLTHYAEIRERDAEAVVRRFTKPVDLWPHTSPTPIDRDIEEFQQRSGEKYRVFMRERRPRTHTQRSLSSVSTS